MAVTQASLRNRIRRIIYSALQTAHPWEDSVQDGGGINSTATSIDVADGANFAAGDDIELDSGEMAQITSVSTNTLTVVRKVLDSTAAAQAQFSVIRKSPRIRQDLIDDAVEAIFEDFYPQIFTIKESNFVYSAGTHWYPLTESGLKEVLSLYVADTERLVPRTLRGWEHKGGLDASEFTEVQGINVWHSGNLTVNQKVYFHYKAEILTVDDLLDRQEGLVATGAVYQLLGYAGVWRTYDPGKRTDRTVQPGQEMRDSYWFFTEFQRMRTREEIRLFDELDRLMPVDRVQARLLRYRP